ncbi:MAG: PAS domain S-box protein, partial [Bacilli bacterium]|nr:PAS domain S-box protein [Bacilli bacterium]
QTSYTAVTNMFSIAIENYFRHLIMQPSVLELLHQAKEAPSEEKAVLRGLLYRELYTLYNGELKRLGIRQLHFHTPQGESFLRFHKPDENGDALIDIRPSIKIANVDKKFVSGFEGGRILPGFRYVFPIVDKEVHLGSVELSLSYESIEFELSKLLTSKNHILLMRKEVTTSIVFENQKEHFMPTNFTKNYVIENEKLSMLTAKSIKSPLVHRVNELLEALPDIEKKLASGKNFSIPFVDNDQGYIANFNAIYDISNTLSAYAVTYGLLDELVIIENKYVIFYSLGLVLLVLLGVALFLFLEQRKKTLREKVQFQTIVEQTVSGILLIDKQRNITFINEAGCRMLEYNSDEIIGLDSHEKIHSHEHLSEHERCPILEVTHSGKNYIGEEVFCKKSGEKIIVHLNAA